MKLSAAGLVMVGLLAAPASAVERVQIGAFAIDAVEVSVGRYKAHAQGRGLVTAAEREGGGFEFAGGWTRRPGWTVRAPSGQLAQDNEPAVHVTWGEARDFCAAGGGRLPTFEEWRLAAYTETRETPTDGFIRGRTYTYPVGDSPEGMNTNRRGHAPVGTTKRGVNGLHDMGANVWEWVADRRDGEALTAGGSWWYGPAQAMETGAQWKPAAFYAVYVGFRCAYDVPRS